MTGFAVRSLHNKFLAENVTEFGAVSISTTSNLLFVIIIIRTGQQMTKNQFWDINAFFRMNFNRNALSIVVYTYGVVFSVNVYFDGRHFWISDLIIRYFFAVKE